MRECSSAPIPEDVIRTLMVVHESWLEASLEAINRDYGSVRVFAERELGVGEALRERLRAGYLG